jgi:hypothetical protein
MKPSRILRHLAVLTLVSCVATGFLRAEAYPLDDLSYEPPVGSVHTESTEVVSDKIKVEYNAGEKKAAGEGTSKLSQVVVTRRIDDSTMEIVVTKGIQTGTMSMNGNPMPPSSNPNPLVDKRITGRKIDGKWTLRLDGADEPTEAQAKDLEKMSNELNTANWVYSTEKRKVGDSWDGDEALMKSISGLDTEVTGKVKITFTRLVEQNGETCAVLETEFDLSGKSDEGYTLGMKGKQESIRSLRHFCDLRRELKAVATMKGSNNGVVISMETPMHVVVATSIESP